MKNAIINQSKSGKFFWWAHLASIDVLTRKNRNKPPIIKDTLHMLRDSTACLFLSELIKEKYNFGGLLYNIPPDIYFGKMKKEDQVFSSLPNLSKNDLLLFTTRPAMNDDKYNDKRCLFKSSLELENMVLQNMKNFFHYCNRQYIILSKEIKRLNMLQRSQTVCKGAIAPIQNTLSNSLEKQICCLYQQRRFQGIRL
ncbi:MAG: hypothetical protein NUV44_09320 [Candidatus Scalindua sp.]|nr:hypothetical protein [Candidatus Scalindua sp.]